MQSIFNYDNAKEREFLRRKLNFKTFQTIDDKTFLSIIGILKHECQILSFDIIFTMSCTRNIEDNFASRRNNRATDSATSSRAWIFHLLENKNIVTFSLS